VIRSPCDEDKRGTLSLSYGGEGEKFGEKRLLWRREVFFKLMVCEWILWEF
jgi:hypothetical protein